MNLLKAIYVLLICYIFNPLFPSAEQQEIDGVVTGHGFSPHISQQEPVYKSNTAPDRTHMISKRETAHAQNALPPAERERSGRRDKRPDCPLQCICVDANAYCDGVRLRSLPRFLAPNLRAIYMRENFIKRLSYKRLRNLKEVRHLLLKGNRIRQVEHNAFQDLNQLISLSLTDNQLRYLPVNAFYGLSHLRVLSIRYNKLHRVDGLFANGYNLQLINLASNELKTISEHVFQRTNGLQMLDLHKNKITYIAPTAFINCPLLKYVILRENPLIQLALHFHPAVQLRLLDASHCELTDVVGGLPQVVDDLRLNDNLIVELREDDFKKVQKIRLLVLNNNRLKFIHQKALTSLKELHDIYVGKNQLTEVPAVPANIHGIYANYNNITRIIEGNFQFSIQLEFIFLRHNEIEEIEETAFHGLRYVRSFDLSRNHIMMLKRYTFLYMTRLELLDLTKNPLKELEYGCFHGLRKLSILQMSSVATQTSIAPSTFRDLHSLAFLDLSNSSTLVRSIAKSRFDMPPFSTVQDLNLMDDQLNTLSPDFPNYFPKLRVIKLVGNPWHCNKTIMWLVDWMRNSSIEFFASNYMTCATPPKLRGRALQSLESEDLHYDIQSENRINLNEYDLIFEIIDNRNEGGHLTPGKLNLDIYPKRGSQTATLNEGYIPYSDQSVRHSHLNIYRQVAEKYDNQGKETARLQNTIFKPPQQLIDSGYNSGAIFSEGAEGIRGVSRVSMDTLDSDKAKELAEEDARLSDERLRELREGTTYQEVQRAGALRNLYDDSSGFVDSDELLVV